MRIDMDTVFGLGPSHKGTCENCKESDVLVRRVQSYAGEFGSGSRGHFWICYNCFKAHKKSHVGKGRYQKTIYTPIRNIGEKKNEMSTL